MRYRNRFVFSMAAAAIIAQPATVVYLAFFDTVFSDAVLDMVALIAIASLVTWLFVRVGIQPLIVCEGGVVTVHNPFLSYRAPLSHVRLYARDGGFGIRIEGVGVVYPWVLSRSVFDGARPVGPNRSEESDIRCP